jgi:hypothetical protein
LPEADRGVFCKTKEAGCFHLDLPKVIADKVYA